MTSTNVISWSIARRSNASRNADDGQYESPTTRIRRAPVGSSLDGVQPGSIRVGADPDA